MPIPINCGDLPEHPRRGAVWSIEEPDRQLDSNVIRLPAGEAIETHVGAEVDTLLHILHGVGTLLTDAGEQLLRPGDIVFLPRRTLRGFRAGEDDLEYLTVHRKRQSLQIQSVPSTTPGSASSSSDSSTASS